MGNEVKYFCESHSHLACKIVSYDAQICGLFHSRTILTGDSFSSTTQLAIKSIYNRTFFSTLRFVNVCYINLLLCSLSTSV